MQTETLNTKPKFELPQEVLHIDAIKLAIPEEKKQSNEYYTRVKHMCNLGDIIAIMPSLKKYHHVTKREVILCQQVNAPAAYYPGATHPTTDDNGTMVCINNKMFEMIKPLVESQEYVYAMEKYEGQHIDFNFDVIRGQTDVGMPNGMIQSWIMYAFCDLDYDLSSTWIDLPKVKKHPILEQVKGKIILNFTERYRNQMIEYYFLQAYSPDLIFSGTEREHFLFCNRWKLNIPRLEINDFLEYAYAIKYSRFLLGNQSFGWNLATAMGTKRVLEVCKYAPNCQPFIGENSKGYMYDMGAQYHFRKFYNETR